MKPLAERMRPQSLDDYVGQRHLVGQGAVLRRAIESGNVPSMIFWGPPGVGKTTLARIMSNNLQRAFYTLSAVSSGVKDVRETIKKAESGRFFDRKMPILFIDEIHRFSKSQQDSLLGAVEKGTVTLVGATTENPSFEVISALLSRCQVYVLKHLEEEDLLDLLRRALDKDDYLNKKDIELAETDALVRYSGGDARRLLNILELVVNALAPEGGGGIRITDEAVGRILQDTRIGYDKAGDQHYDIASALIKSIRGSDPNAAVYYLARMLEGGEDVKFIARRLIISASEDIGLANPNALLLAQTCFDSVSVVGLPEGRIIYLITMRYLPRYVAQE
jgi:putative ATPase